MTRRLRKTLIVSAVLLAVASIIGLRLDSAALNARLTEQLSQYSGSTLQTESTSLSLMHGIGVRLDGVSIDHPSCQIQAKHINISMRLLPLLLGNIEIDGLDIHDAVFKLKSNDMVFDVGSIASLPVHQINLIRSRIVAADGAELLNNLRLELRGIGSEHETLWELNSQALSGHGRILFHQGQAESSFGKIKLSNMPVSKLRSFAPASLMGWIDDEGNTLSGSLTIDMTGQQSWAVFGSMLLNNEATALAVNLRGKLSHPTAGQLIWKDSFIHLSDKAVIAITGSCKQDNCNTRLDAKNIALTRWQPFIPKGITFHRRISGLSNVAADLQWNEKTWQGKAAIKLKQASFQHADQNIVLPDLNLHIRELSGSSKAWQAQASISSDGLDGSIDVQSQQQANGKKHLEMKSKNAGSKLWQPLANLLLSSLNISPTLQANGNIQGSLHVHQNGQRKTLTLDVDATATQIKASPWLKKQAGVTAICHATVQFTGTAAHSMGISDCQLGASQVGQLNWAEKNAKQVLTVSKLDLNLAQLKIHEIPLPSLISALSGKLKGSGKTSWTDNNPWTNNIHGDWQLINIGNTTWQANGDVRARKGVFNSKNLRLDGDFGQAELKGSYDVVKQRGNIDISSGKLDWNAPPALNSFWQKISLRGNIKPSELTLVHNNWHNLRSNYKLSQGTLNLQKLQADIAGGSISSDKLLLSAQTEGWRIQGNMRAKNIQLDQLQGLNTWLQADIRGTLHANIKLNGTFPQTNLQDWQRSNGDILIYSGNWQQQLPKESLTERLGIKAPALKTYAFRKLEFRFRIQPDQAVISGIRLLRHKQNYHGKASIKPDFHLSGSMQQQSDNSNYVIDSKIPYINWSRP